MSEIGKEERRTFLQQLAEAGGRAVADNIRARVESVEVGGRTVPVVLPEAGLGNCYVCSLRAQYGDYACYEIDARKLGFFGDVFKGLVRILDGVLAVAGGDKVVFVNNWLLSTNLYESGLEDDLEVLLTDIEKRFPGRAIVFRSLTPCFNGSLMERLKKRGFKRVCSREIYILDTREGLHSKRSDFRRDEALLEESGLEVVGPEAFQESDLPRARELYQSLYLEKYSRLNPQFTQWFFEEGWRSGFLKFVGLKDGELLIGVVGYTRAGSVITAPILGYDTGSEVRGGVYRMLTLLLTREGERLGCVIHRSSGAARFKQSRGAEAALEYSSVYWGHLPWWRRWGWSLWVRAVNAVVGFALKRVER